MGDVIAHAHLHDGHAGGNRHVERAFLERQQALAQVARAFREAQIDVSLCCNVRVVVSIARRALYALPRSISTLPASQNSWPNNGTHFRLFLAIHTVRCGAAVPSTNRS